jgi:hypothetical protein
MTGGGRTRGQGVGVAAAVVGSAGLSGSVQVAGGVVPVAGSVAAVTVEVVVAAAGVFVSSAGGVSPAGQGGGHETVVGAGGVPVAVATGSVGSSAGVVGAVVVG